MNSLELGEVSRRIHMAAREGMAISIFALLWNMDQDIVRDLKYFDHHQSHYFVYFPIFLSLYSFYFHT